MHPHASCLSLQTSPQQPASKHPRRLSSTPLQRADVNQEPLPEPASVSVQSSSTQDDSLEEVLFDNTSGKDTSKTMGMYSLPSPRLSTILMDSSREFGARKSALSSVKGLEEGSKKRLSVSFLKEDTDKNSSKSKRKLTRHSTQRNLDESLMHSFSSPYRDTEQSYALARKGKESGAFLRRMAAGSDPRLGYDWIAGLLDSSGPSLSDRDNEYFNELNEFRKVNYEECHRPKEVV